MCCKLQSAGWRQALRRSREVRKEEVPELRKRLKGRRRGSEGVGEEGGAQGRRDGPRGKTKSWRKQERAGGQGESRGHKRPTADRRGGGGYRGRLACVQRCGCGTGGEGRRIGGDSFVRQSAGEAQAGCLAPRATRAQALCQPMPASPEQHGGPQQAPAASSGLLAQRPLRVPTLAALPEAQHLGSSCQSAGWQAPLAPPHAFMVASSVSLSSPLV